MKLNHLIQIVILLFIISLSSCATIYHKKDDINKMDYTLSWDGNSNFLEVELRYLSQHEDSSTFVYGSPDFGGQLDIFDVLKIISVDDGDRFKLYPEERKIVIRHEGKTKKKYLKYTIDGSLVYGKDNPEPYWKVCSERFRPLIIKNHLYVYGESYLMQYESDKEIQHQIRWKNSLEGLTVFESYDMDRNPLTTAHTTYNELANSVSIISDRIKVIRKEIKDVPHYFITDKEDNKVDKAINEKTDQYFSDIMAFWNDYDHPYYWAVMTPTVGMVTEGHSGLSGYAHNDGFFMNYAGDIDPKSIVLTICHETVHRWIGHQVRIGNSSFDHPWLGEGFTEYITLYTAAKSGLIDLDEFYGIVNEDNFRRHYMSKVNTYHNDFISKFFWKSIDIQSLPYTRGLIFAFYMDNQIRLASNNTQTIRDFLMELHTKARKIYLKTDGEKSLTLNDFIQIGGKYMDKNELEESVNRYAIQGELIDFKEVSLIDDFKITYSDPYEDYECSTVKEAYSEKGLLNAIGEERAEMQKKEVLGFEELLINKSIDSFLENTVDGFTFLNHPVASLAQEINGFMIKSICVKSVEGSDIGWSIMMDCSDENGKKYKWILKLDHDYHYVSVSKTPKVRNLKLKESKSLTDLYH